MTCHSRAFMPRGRHHFSAPWPLIMHPRVARLLVLFYSSLVSGPVILSAAGAKYLLSAVPDARPDSRTVARVRSVTADPSLAPVSHATTEPLRTLRDSRSLARARVPRYDRTLCALCGTADPSLARVPRARSG